MWVLQIVKFRHATFAARKAAATNITCKTVLNSAARENPKFDLHPNRRLHRDLLLQQSLHFLCSVHNAHKDKLLASSPSTLYEGALLEYRQ